jgi:hypothetical protein
VTHSKRDANEAAIVRDLRLLGVWCLPMHREAGFDLLLGFRGRLYAVEIKDPAQAPSARRLTANEINTQRALALVDIPYSVCETLADVLANLGET